MIDFANLPMRNRTYAGANFTPTFTGQCFKSYRMTLENMIYCIRAAARKCIGCSPLRGEIPRVCRRQTLNHAAAPQTLMYDFFYHNGKNHPNCLHNINESLGETRPIIHPVNLFMYSRICADGTISVKRPLSKAGDKIVLKAEMDMRLGIAACSVSESDCNSRNCTSIRLVIED